jgi:hypothetical protein
MGKQSRTDPCSVNRRGFLGASALAMGALAGSSMAAVVSVAEPERELNPLLREKLNVKLIAQGVTHESAWEGPCRTGKLENLTYAAELARLKSEVAKLPALAKGLGPEAHALEPVFMELYIKKGDVRFYTSEKELAKLEGDKDDTDLYVIVGGARPQFTAIEIGKRFQKPVAFVNTPGSAGWVTAMPTHLRPHGLECYVAFDWEELQQLVSLLRVRKAFRNTRLLAVTDSLGGNMMSGVIENVSNLQAMKAQLGVDYAVVSYQDFSREFDAIARDEQKAKEASAITDRLMHNSRKCHMLKENIKPTVDFYLTIRHLFQRHGCNAFSIGCFEFCSSTIPAQKRITPCLVHSLLKDQGYPSACEGDLNALATVSLFEYLARKSVYMGNVSFDDKNGWIGIHHDVPGRKMRGFDQPDVQYELMHFALAGWGASLRCDWNIDKGQPVTFGRFNSVGSRILISHGEIHNGYGLDTHACSHGVRIKAPSVREFFRKELEIGGQHLSMVYGDYRAEIRRLGEIMHFEVVEVS